MGSGHNKGLDTSPMWGHQSHDIDTVSKTVLRCDGNLGNATLQTPSSSVMTVY